MKFLTAILLFVFSYSNAQNINLTHEFKFYKNGKFLKSNDLQLFSIKGMDTIEFNVASDKIKIPKINFTGSILVVKGKKKYLIEEVDFSKIDENSNVLFGIENNFENLIKVSDKYQSARTLKNNLILLNVENLEQAKEICFVIFSSVIAKQESVKSSKSYSKMAISKFKNLKK